ncbi:MAG: 4Fe-4S binding protein [Nitrospinae bacterium]|nr:4Fe-4S binding protein [Nitrospinota bacterium]
MGETVGRGVIYTAVYTTAMVVFGIYAIMTKYKTSFRQTLRFCSFFFFQIVIFFILPYFILNQAFYESHGQNFLLKPGLSWGLVYPWPLQSYPFMEQGVAAMHGSNIWSGQPIPAQEAATSVKPFIYTLILAFVAIPIFVYFLGKRFCSWICSCGGLGETLGDPFRKYAGKGWRAKEHEDIGIAILISNVLVFGYVLIVGVDIVSRGWYTDIVDIWLAGIIPIALTFFYGGRVWCRAWCPLATYMSLIGKYISSRFRLSVDKSKCMGCYECTRSCQMGIDVMEYVQKGEDITLKNARVCVGCGICVFTCPMKALKLGKREALAAA